jgi:hypothetical protein
MTARGWHLLPLAVPILLAACDAERIAAPARDARSDTPPVQMSVGGGMECTAPAMNGRVVCTLGEGSATWTAPAGITTAAVVFELRGGSGGNWISGGGLGGITIASAVVAAGSSFEFLAGGRGADGGTATGAGAGGANGGGAGGVSPLGRGAGGGGATVVKCVAPTGCTLPLLVAGGGGGGPLGGHAGPNGLPAFGFRGGQGASGSSVGAGGTASGFCTGSGSSGMVPPGGNGGAGGGGTAVVLFTLQSCPPGGGGGGGLFGGGGGATGEYNGSVPPGGGGGGSGRIAPGFDYVAFTLGNVGNGSLSITYYVHPPKVTITVMEPIDPLTNWYNLATSGSDGVVVQVSAPDGDGLTCVIDGEQLGIKSNSASIPLEDGSHTISCTASIGQLTGAGPGSTTMPLLVDVDQTPPTLDVALPKLISVGSNALAIPVASDATSGVATESCEPLDTSTPGSKEVTCSATDHAGNVTTDVFGYYVDHGYSFSGFLAPISTDKVNQVQAGRAVPVKFSLSGDFGLDIMMPGYPSSQVVACQTSDLVDEVDETLSAGSSSLSYDADTDVYTYVWKTQASWAGSCRLLLIRLHNGQTYTASFTFRK